MPAAGRSCWAEWEEVGQLTVIRFVVRGVARVQEIIDLFEELDQHVRQGDRRVLLNFAGVEAFTSYPIGKLLTLDRKLRGLGGRLALCALTPVVSDIIDIMKLRRQLNIYDTEQDALQSF
jgi:anti-anti-sigma factor